MNKYDITKKLISLDENYKDNPKALNMLYKAWWVNWRNTENRRFRLTDTGYDYFTNVAGIKFYDVRFPPFYILTNRMIIDLDNFIDCPYHLTNERLQVTSEKIVLQLVLFDGDLVKFGKAKRETKRRKLEK